MLVSQKLFTDLVGISQRLINITDNEWVTAPAEMLCLYILENWHHPSWSPQPSRWPCHGKHLYLCHVQLWGISKTLFSHRMWSRLIPWQSSTVRSILAQERGARMGTWQRWLQVLTSFQPDWLLQIYTCKEYKIVNSHLHIRCPHKNEPSLLRCREWEGQG